MAAPQSAARKGYYDLDAGRAARAEARGEPFVIGFCGQEYQIPPARDWPIEATDALSSGALSAALRLLLGEDQYATFMVNKPTVGDVEDLMKAVAKWQDLTLGE